MSGQPTFAGAGSLMIEPLERLRRALVALAINSEPGNGLSQRQAERQKLEEFLTERLSPTAQQGRALYVCGPVGTGKTAAVDDVVSRYSQQQQHKDTIKPHAPKRARTQAPEPPTSTTDAKIEVDVDVGCGVVDEDGFLFFFFFFFGAATALGRATGTSSSSS